MSRTGSIFLTAEWRDLLMLNYEVDPSFLQKYIPRGTELDLFDGKTYISLVGFLFCRAKLHGRFLIPFHRQFEEINLRFYVRRYSGSENRRGVVFIAEIVPKLAIAKTARWFYRENYVCRRMKHRVPAEVTGNVVEYGWKQDAEWCALKARVEGSASLPAEGSVQQFITEHYWGYSAQKNGGTLEYRVEHVPWRVWTSSEGRFTGNPAALYGEDFARVLKRPPNSAFIAEGSPISVHAGNPVS